MIVTLFPTLETLHLCLMKNARKLNPKFQLFITLVSCSSCNWAPIFWFLSLRITWLPIIFFLMSHIALVVTWWKGLHAKSSPSSNTTQIKQCEGPLLFHFIIHQLLKWPYVITSMLIHYFQITHIPTKYLGCLNGMLIQTLLEFLVVNCVFPISLH